MSSILTVCLILLALCQSKLSLWKDKAEALIVIKNDYRKLEVRNPCTHAQKRGEADVPPTWYDSWKWRDD